MLSVRADDDLEDGIIEVMNRNGAVDIDERAAQWKSADWTPDAGEIRMPVVKEELRIGKRQITSGGVRVYSQVTETPVEEEIRLREQRVTVDRRPVDRALTPGEAAFEDEAIEVTESHEEPIILKAARVTEEVVVKKENTERTETVRDTVRRKDVEVEKAGTDDKGAGKIRKAG